MFEYVQGVEIAGGGGCDLESLEKKTLEKKEKKTLLVVGSAARYVFSRALWRSLQEDCAGTSVYLLYWYKSTNRDAILMRQYQPPLPQQSEREARSLRPHTLAA
jgi:hypothetical protein